MSARDAVLDTMYFAEEWSSKPYEEFKKECAAELDAYRAEVLREAATKLALYPETQWWGQGENRDDPSLSGIADEWHDAAALVRRMADQTGEITNG